MVLNARATFCLFFGWNDFSHKKKSIIRSLFDTAITIRPPPPKSTMNLPVVTVKEGMETKKQTKTKIGVGSDVKAKVRELENIKREGRIRRMRKDLVGCVHSVVGKKKFLVQFKDGQKKEISSSSLVFSSPKEDVEMDEPISHLPEK